MFTGYKSTIVVMLLAALFLLPPHGASAQLIVLTAPSQLDASDVTTVAYLGISTDVIASPLTVAAGNNQVTLTAVNGSTFFRFDSDATQVDFPAFTPLIATADASFSPNGPLRLDFAQPVREFGLSAQSLSIDTETFSLTAFAGSTPLGTFTTPPTDNTSFSGAALFLGAQAPGGNEITSVVISSLSDLPGQDNGFYVGPITLSAGGTTSSNVPEPGINAVVLCCAISLTAFRLLRQLKRSELPR